MSFLSDLVKGDFGDLGGDITGMFSPSNLGQTLEGAAAVAAPFAIGALAPALGFGEVAGLGAGAADAAGSAAPLGFAPEAALGSGAPDLSGFLGDTPITTDPTLPFAGGAEAPPITPNAYVGQNFGDWGPVNAPGLAPGETSAPLGYTQADPALTNIAQGTPFQGGSAENPIPGGVTGGGGTAPDLTGSYGNVNSGPVSLSNVAGGGTAPQLGAPPSAGGNWYDNIVNSVTHPTLSGLGTGAGVLAAGGLLTANLLKSNAPPPGSQNLTNVAGAATQQFQQQALLGGQLQNYLATGTLPGPQQAQIAQWISAQKAKVISSYAARGMPTQPGSNSALDQDLAAIDQQGLVMAAQMESQLFANGQQALQNAYAALGVSAGTYNNLAQMDQAQNTQFGNAVATFAGTAAGSSKGLSINLGGTKTA